MGLLTCAALCAALALFLYAGPYPRCISSPIDPSTQTGFYEELRKCQEPISHPKRKNAPSSTRQNPRWNAVSGQKEPIAIQNATLFDGEATLVDPVDVVFDAGLVDMHSHHLLFPFVSLSGTIDTNESPVLGPITPFMRALDGFTPSDPAIEAIASGGITSALIFSGSANTVGGQAYPVKNLSFPGADRGQVIEELLLDNGIPESQRQRYLNMACGENSKSAYGHARPGLAWLLREKLAEAQELQRHQSSWCLSAFEVERRGGYGHAREISNFVEREGQRPDSFELETFLALLRGEVNLNVHCYTPGDLERLLSVLHEFGIHPQALHHALEANVTIATFADNALFKAEAYGADLRGPKILRDHGLRVALKSDHVGEHNYAKFLLGQASISHSFALPADEALKAVTSVPADAIRQGHRIGYVRPGYDADLVIWDDHALQVGATPVEVFIDGRPLLQSEYRTDHDGPGSADRVQKAPAMRPSIETDERSDIYSRVQGSQRPVLFTGIKESLLDGPGRGHQQTHNLVFLVQNKRVSCLGPKSTCLSQCQTQSHPADGTGKTSDPLNEVRSVHFAKYGAVSPPHASGVEQVVSVGVRTAPDATILRGGIWKDEVALHLGVGQRAKNDDAPTVGSEIENVRRILEQGREEEGSGSVYARAANGSLPVVLTMHRMTSGTLFDKAGLPTVNLVIYGGHGADLIATPLAEASIPIFPTGNRGAPDTWEKKDPLPGPPLSDIPAKVLIEAGVELGLAIQGDSKVHGLAGEARWAGKHAGLTDTEALALVPSNIERILGLQSGVDGEGLVVAAVQDGEFVVDCCPDAGL
ncbi:hypothetical protein BDW62DRAFT_215979 [Aspergillus aurantiobrunneus]